MLTLNNKVLSVWGGDGAGFRGMGSGTLFPTPPLRCLSPPPFLLPCSHPLGSRRVVNYGIKPPWCHPGGLHRRGRRVQAQQDSGIGNRHAQNSKAHS